MPRPEHQQKLRQPLLREKAPIGRRIALAPPRKVDVRGDQTPQLPIPENPRPLGQDPIQLLPQPGRVAWIAGCPGKKGRAPVQGEIRFSPLLGGTLRPFSLQAELGVQHLHDLLHQRNRNLVTHLPSQVLGDLPAVPLPGQGPQDRQQLGRHEHWILKESVAIDKKEPFTLLVLVGSQVEQA